MNIYYALIWHFFRHSYEVFNETQFYLMSSSMSYFIKWILEMEYNKSLFPKMECAVHCVENEIRMKSSSKLLTYKAKALSKLSIASLKDFAFICVFPRSMKTGATGLIRVSAIRTSTAWNSHIWTLCYLPITCNKQHFSNTSATFFIIFLTLVKILKKNTLF